MDFDWLKRLMPKGLYGRAALILLLPIVVLQLVVSVVFIQRHFEGVTRQMTASVLFDVRYLLEEVNRADGPEEALQQTAQIQQALGFNLRFGASSAPFFNRRFDDLSGLTVRSYLEENLDGLVSVDLAAVPARVVLVIQSRHGPLAMTFSRRRASAANPHQLLVLMVFIGAVMTGVAFLYLRNQLRPITRLARAAEAFGKGRAMAYHPSGALEVRAAGSAFLDMRNRIERQTAQRTLMLSGVSHDLRTPLTRLRLGLSMQDQTEDVTELLGDVEEMERLVTAFLDFARSDALDDPAKMVPADLVNEAVVAAQRGGGDVHLFEIEGPRVPVSLRPTAVRRALANLIGNALRYAGRAEVSLYVSERAIRFTVEDDGPGIPAERREEAIRPFTRLDSSRNQNKGSGVGLGLSIAMDIARGHGGSLRLSESERLGGLRVDLVLAR